MASRSILGLASILGGLRQLGEDVAPVLARYGFDLDRIDPTARIDRELELRIYTDVAETLKDPLAGLKAGTHVGIGSYGPFTMLVMTCDTGYEAFRAGVRYQQLTYLFSTLRLEPGSEVTALALAPLPLSGKVFRFRVDAELSGTWKLIRDLQNTFGLNLLPQSIDMPYAKPPESAAYEALFDCPVRWGEHEARCWIRNEDLQVRLPTADPAAHRYFRAQCDQLLAELNPAGETLTTRVKLHLGLFAGSTPAAADLAAALGISERTFRRQLDAENTSFRALLDEVRYEKACQLLTSTGQPVEAIAQQLGYAEAASFIHAFQRWAGETPAAWRRRQRAPG